MRKEKNEKDTLMTVSADLLKSVKVFNEINSTAGLIAMNATIEGARMRMKAPSFSIVAQQIYNQSLKNIELSENLSALVDKIQDISLRATSSRFYEIAEDLIDKIDRNLFERNCDVQAWATFESIINCAENFKDEGKDDITYLTDETKVKASQDAAVVLKKLVDTYMVYSDIIILNKNGLIICSAIDEALLGSNCIKESWFNSALGGNVHVSELRSCPILNKYIVSYSSPVRDSSGEIIGVISTRFNWDFGQEIIDHSELDEGVRAYFIDQKGKVLASTQSFGVMEDHLFWLEGARSSCEGHCGYSVEKDRNGTNIAIGYAKTKGYNAYRGKKWSSVVTSKIENENEEFFVSSVDKRTDERPLGTKESHDLIESEITSLNLQKIMQEVGQLVRQISINNKEAKFLAINASIQSGIAGEDGEGFAVIANEIGHLAKKSLNFVHNMNELSLRLQYTVESTVKTRLLDAAKDAIDKVDRNLFERFCDVQAWTTFNLFLNVVNDKSLRGEACELASRLHQIYEVYHDIIILNTQGDIVVSAKNKSLIDQNQKDREWFQEAISGRVYFSDIYYSKSFSAPVMTFSAPLQNNKGEIIGVLSTRFNCNFLNDILKSVIADSKSSVIVVNKSGLIVSTSDGKNILEKATSDIQETLDKSSNLFGINTVSKLERNSSLSISYAKGRGYNSFPGKDWYVVITRPDEVIEKKNNGNINVQVKKAS
jgi:hypothetical protein